MHIYKLNIHQIECIIIHSYVISFNRKISKILNQPKICIFSQFMYAITESIKN